MTLSPDPNMPRTIVDIPPETLGEVDAICQRLQISRAEAVRRGLIAFVKENSGSEKDSFGLWKGQTTGKAVRGMVRGKW
jgi:metal-responsive CopG/Arc/MetJ family transcriptional regulator